MSHSTDRIQSAEAQDFLAEQNQGSAIGTLLGIVFALNTVSVVFGLLAS